MAITLQPSNALFGYRGGGSRGREENGGKEGGREGGQGKKGRELVTGLPIG